MKQVRAAMVINIAIVQKMKAFIAVASVYPRVRHGKWIPLTYWTPKVSLKLQEPIQPRKLFKVLEKLHVINRDFTADDAKTYGSIKKVESTGRRITKEGCSKLSRVGFLFIVTAEAPAEKLPVNQTELARFFQQRHDAYHRRKSMLDPPTQQQYPPKEAAAAEQTLPKIDTEFATSDHSPVPACITPPNQEENVLYNEQNNDLLVLLGSIIRPEYMERFDLLQPGACLDSFRLTIQSIGRSSQLEANKEHYETLAKDRYDDDIKVNSRAKYEPLLNRFCCPWSKRAIQGFLHTALQLAETDPSILQLRKYGGLGYGQRLVAVVPGDTPKKFYKNGKSWLQKLYQAVGGGTMTRYDVCFWMIKLHRFYEPKAFEDACRIFQTALSFKMDPYRQIAMFDRNNMTYEHGRGMRPYFNADKCNPLHSERQIRKLEVHPSVRPNHVTFLEEGNLRNAWFLSVKDAVNAELEQNNSGAELDEIHVMLSADHGQGAFRVNVSVIQVIDNKVATESDLLLGHIDCRKDATQVLVDSTVLAQINASLKDLNESIVKVMLLATGDLAWYSIALGKPAMSGEHCWRCKCRWKDFQNDPRHKGAPWTLHELQETYRKLEDGRLNRKDKNQERGVVSTPLVDCVEPTNFLFPPLHALDLLTNTPYKYIQKWVWNRLEDVPLELIEQRETRAAAALEVESLWNDVIEVEKPKLIMQEELKSLLPTNEEIEFDDDHHQEEWLKQKELVLQATKDSEIAHLSYEVSKKAYNKLTAALNKVEKKKEFGKQSRDLWMQVERLLRKDFNIYSSTYHGGDLEGNECRRLLRHAVPALGAVKALLLAHLATMSEAEKEKRADIKEINIFMEAFQRLLQYMDVM